MALAPQLRALLEQAQRDDAHSEAQRILLDKLSDLHNDLLQWTVDTEHSEAALEVDAILEQHIKKTKVKGKTQLMAEKVNSEVMPTRVTG